VPIALPQGKVDQQRATDDVFAGNEAPVAAVFAVVAVIAEDEVVSGWDDEISVVDELAHANPPAGVDGWVGVLEPGKVVAKVIGHRPAVDGVGLIETEPIDEDMACTEADVIPGDSDDSFDKVDAGLDGEVKDDDVSAVNGRCGEEERVRRVGGNFFIDKEEVADHEGGLHGAGGDAKGLNGKCDDEDRDDDDGDQRLDRRKKSGRVGVRLKGAVL
jgi:hypothetical protein